MTQRLTSLQVPTSTLAVAVFELDGEVLHVRWFPIADTVQPPRRQLVSVLRSLADHFEREANEVDGASS